MANSPKGVWLSPTDTAVSGENNQTKCIGSLSINLLLQGTLLLPSRPWTSRTASAFTHSGSAPKWPGSTVLSVIDWWLRRWDAKPKEARRIRTGKTTEEKHIPSIAYQHGGPVKCSGQGISDGALEMSLLHSPCRDACSCMHRGLLHGNVRQHERIVQDVHINRTLLVNKRFEKRSKNHLHIYQTMALPSLIQRKERVRPPWAVDEAVPQRRELAQ